MSTLLNSNVLTAMSLLLASAVMKLATSNQTDIRKMKRDAANLVTLESGLASSTLIAAFSDALKMKKISATDVKIIMVNVHARRMTRKKLNYGKCLLD